MDYQISTFNYIVGSLKNSEIFLNTSSNLQTKLLLSYLAKAKTDLILFLSSKFLPLK